MEVGKVIIAAKTTAQTPSEAEYQNTAEGGESQSGVDIRFCVRSKFVGQEFEDADADR